MTSSTPLSEKEEVTLTYRTVASASGINIGGISYTRGWVLSGSLKITVGQGLTVYQGALDFGMIMTEYIIEFNNFKIYRLVYGNDS